MMDSKQLALIYLMEESNQLASVCTRNVHSLHKKSKNDEIAKQMGNIFAAMKEVVEEFKLDEATVMGYAEKEVERRAKDR